MLLKEWSKGDGEALDRLIPLVDRELRKIAHAYMSKERPDNPLQTTALINEALIRFMEADKPDWQSRAHFYSIVARRMRQILIEHARQQLTAKRGQRAQHVDLTEIGHLSSEKSEEMIILDQVLTKLAKIDERKALIVEYRYFGGFTFEEVAGILKVSISTVEREWRLARSWLHREMVGDAPHERDRLVAGGGIEPPTLGL